MNGQIYDPLIGRFMSADPYIQAPSDLQSFNRYAYVRNNPLNLTDPSGYSWWTKVRDKFVKPLIAKFLDVYCGGCATLALHAWNGYHAKDVNGKKLGWKGAVFYAGLSLIPGSDNMLVNIGVNALKGCGSSIVAGGSCSKGMVDAVTVEAFGPIAGGCLNARRAGGSCAVGAREAATTLLGNQMASNTANEAHRWNDARIARNKAEQAAAEDNEPVEIAQVSQGIRGAAAGSPAIGHVSPAMCDSGPCPIGGMRPSVQLPPMPEFNLWNILPMPVKIGFDWIMSVNDASNQKPNGVPDDWTQEPGKKDGNTKWVNPNNPHDYVRRKPNGDVTQVRDGKALDVNGNRVGTKTPEAHGIKPEDFIFRP